MAKKVKTEELKMTCCENCKHWNKQFDGNFGLCMRIRKGKDALFSGNYLQTAANFMCYLNAPNEVVELTEKDNENEDNTDAVADS